MNLVDANVLLYAVNTDVAHHASSRRWLDEALSGAAPVGFSWIGLLAFVRLATKVGLFPRPLPPAEALDQVQHWLDAGPSVLLQPTVDHLSIVRRLVEPVGTGGNLVSDAHLAALSVEHRCIVVTYDGDFRRFAGVRAATPDELLDA